MNDLSTISLGERSSKVAVGDFARSVRNIDGAASLLEAFPRILGGQAIREVVAALRAARRGHRPIIWGLGGHVIKVGLAPVLLELAAEGFVDVLALNGAAVIHDFEIALAGHTSQDVQVALERGDFGMTEETGTLLNEIYAGGVRAGLGLGEALTEHMRGRSLPFGEHSLLAGAARLRIPVSVHLALGTDTSHFHPSAAWDLLGTGARRDFARFSAWVAELGRIPDTDGPAGVYLNVGSAVLLPEVFLKAITVARNLGRDLTGMVTVCLDFLAQYRSTENVVRRPPAALGGKGYFLCGHHEIQIPLLAAALLDRRATGD
ncbi:MAG: hypothetical protein HYV63_03080 [Candidatus Schekmanbacteria bacterium]|nr:hypothetical protein [Candidatus Schekmanbacteria bacterium]